MLTKKVFVLFGTLTLGLNMTLGRAQTESASDLAGRCDALRGVDFSLIPDAPTQISETKSHASDSNKPSYCEIGGFVAPRVEFVLRLPSKHWNGKFIELGCGGYCGSLEHIQGCDGPLRRGYACIVSDGGHKAEAAEPMKWAYRNPQAAIEYIVRASHVTALAGKAIVRHYYGQTPRKSYFMGCSAGGVQAMWEAQRFPWDFDGIVAGGPALSLSRNWLNWLWGNRALMGGGDQPLLGHAELDVLHKAVVAQCDLNDGIRDGVIGDPRACHFNPAELRCATGESRRCFTAQQVEAAARIYSGPTTSKGEKIAAPMALKGSERSWSVFEGSKYHPNPGYAYWKDWFHYSIFGIDLGSGWTPGNFDFDRDYKRLGAMEALEPINSPDLRRFRATGGKLLAYTGWNDAAEGVLNTIEYYETAEKVIGGRAATQDFFRLFVVPGMGHCAGGDGAFAIDYLTALEAWVEKGEAPERLVGAHVRLNDLKPAEALNDAQERERRLRFPLDPAYIEFTRSVFPYPEVAKYSGRGDPKKAASYERAAP